MLHRLQPIESPSNYSPSSGSLSGSCFGGLMPAIELPAAWFYCLPAHDTVAMVCPLTPLTWWWCIYQVVLSIIDEGQSIMHCRKQQTSTPRTCLHLNMIISVIIRGFLAKESLNLPQAEWILQQIFLQMSALIHKYIKYPKYYYPWFCVAINDAIIPCSTFSSSFTLSFTHHFQNPHVCHLPQRFSQHLNPCRSQAIVALHVNFSWRVQSF